MNLKTDRPLPFLMQGIAQIAILVPDLKQAITHYYEDFGIGPWQIYTYGKPLVQEMTYKGQPAEYKMRIGLAKIGPLRIELIEPLSGESIYADFIEEHGYGVHHFGLLVSEMDSALNLAQEAGYELIMDGSGFGADGDGHYAYLDTEEKLGITLELISRPRNRVDPEEIYPPDNGY